MRKATFDTKQEAVQFWPAGEMTTVQICQNETQVQEINEETGETATRYQYDFNEWTAADVDAKAIKAAPASYLDFAPAANPTLAERVDQNAANIEYLTMMMEA